MRLLAMPRTGINHALAASAFLLAALAGWPWLMPTATSDRSADAGAAPAAERRIADLPPFANFSALVERPLFSPSRRGAAALPSVGLGAGLEARYRLIGVIAAGPARRAWIADGTRHFEASEGDLLDGWKIVAIEQNRLLLSSPAGEAVLTLRRVPGENGVNPPAGKTPQ
jgi:hypothetical protein